MAEYQYRRRRKKRRSYIDLIVIAMLLMLLILLVALAFLRPKLGGSVKSEVKVEAGDFSLTPEMFLRDGEEAEIDFSDGFDPSSVEKNAVGRYKVGLVVGGKNESATLIVEDTTPPSAEANPRAVDLGSDIEPEALIKNASDNTGITSVTFKKTPDLTKNGTFDVDIVLADASGNKATVTSSLTVVPVHAEITKNVGDEPPTISDFLLNGGSSEGVEAISDLSAVDMSRPGDITLDFSQDGVRFSATLHLVDGTAPVISLKNLSGWSGSEIAAEEFILSCEDISPVTFSFAEEPDWSASGDQTVKIKAADSAGNTSVGTATLTLIADTQPPVIKGVHDQVVYIGDGISYLSGVTAEDNADPDPEITVYADDVDTRSEGRYTVVYTAEDRSGNTSRTTAEITVVERTVDEEKVMSLAESVISSIITEDMTGYQKIKAIYTWVRGNVRYEDTSEKDDWLRGAYAGLHDHKGDCYTYQMTSKALLDAAGIENKLIDTVPLRYLHCWNLVNIGEGWYHFDTTPRKGGFDGFYLDDKTLMAYSDSHSNSHIYDHDKFPDAVYSAN